MLERYGKRIKTHNENFFTQNENFTAHSTLLHTNGSNFLHTKNPRVIHRDLKPKNIFLKSDEVIKVGDFGVSTFVKNAPRESNELLSEQTYVGTYCYRAPEVLSLSDYNESIDMWAFGCIIFECIKFELAFPLAKQRDLCNG